MGRPTLWLPNIPRSGILAFCALNHFQLHITFCPPPPDLSLYITSSLFLYLVCRFPCDINECQGMQKTSFQPDCLPLNRQKWEGGARGAGAEKNTPTFLPLKTFAGSTQRNHGSSKFTRCVNFETQHTKITNINAMNPPSYRAGDVLGQNKTILGPINREFLGV